MLTFKLDERFAVRKVLKGFFFKDLLPGNKFLWLNRIRIRVSKILKPYPDPIRTILMKIGTGYFTVFCKDI